MTVGEAIKRINEFALHHAIQELPNSERTVEAFEMAIDALGLALEDRIKENATTIKVIAIQEIDAKDKLKFLITLLKASRILRANILIGFIVICSFLFE